MKTNLLILLFTSILLFSCSSDDPKQDIDVNPITNLELPQSNKDNPIKKGETVTIKGKGFSSQSELIVDKTAVEITDVSQSSISFVAPDMSGEKNIKLKQDGKEYSLGKLYFDNSASAGAKKRIIKRDYSFDNNESFTFKYDNNGRLEKMTEYGSESKPAMYDNFFTYDKNGNLSYIKELYVDDNNSLQNELFFEYKNKTTIIVKEISYKGESSDTYHYTLTLDAKGRLIKKVENESNYSNSYEYDAAGNIIKSQMYLIDKPDGDLYTYEYKYDDKKSYFSNMGLPVWYWVFDANEDFDSYAGPNNMTQIIEKGKVDTSYKYDYDKDGYPTVIYDALNKNKKIGEFTYEIIK